MADQAEKLRKLAGQTKKQCRVIAITSGKGGVGKTSVSVNLALALATQGARVVLVDTDLGLGNVEVLMGLHSFYNLAHVIEGTKTLEEVVIKAPLGLEVVPGSSGLSRIADLVDRDRDRLVEALMSLCERSDFLLLDTMAGIGKNTVSFCTSADEVLLVTTPEPSSIVDAYAMLKTIHYQRSDAVIKLIVNMVINSAQAQAVATKLTNVAQQYLGRGLIYLGHIVRDTHVNQSIMQSQPFFITYPNAPASRCVEAISQRLFYQAPAIEPKKKLGFMKRLAQNFGWAVGGEI
ncbi:MAG TPA: MinD/ParA family protein [Candidatus Hydrogenedens sp.]|nr:MinD/ParA family protein [Candidatus Hydrogenedens sp.]